MSQFSPTPLFASLLCGLFCSFPVFAQPIIPSHHGKTLAISPAEFQSSFKHQEIRAFQRVLRFYTSQNLTRPAFSLAQPPAAFASWQAYELHLRGHYLFSGSAQSAQNAVQQALSPKP